ncbi:hypothetical protein A9W98_14525 [Mycobacterium gordonae]|uniref:Uncharacterized protein n=1 Tax=Mycobacterium gordonae TaxID=1778 RepID=A0A1A6BJJ3_MYCGO|nr:hypothetical protein [Mycobacterium gordonae]OBS02503.1 hypothetical protein A9W98_14525 [Mycobacterium gordonae]
MSRIIVKLQPTDIAWLGLITYVLGVNITLPEQLSMAMDRYLKAHRWTFEAVLFALYCHLSNRVPDRYDPIHWLFVALVKALHRHPRITVVVDD